MAEKHVYLIVEFPEETKDGLISMALISSTWLFNEDSAVFCYWPTYLKSTLSREKALKNHTPLNYDKCIKCPILVKASDGNYDKANAKLRHLEEESEQSAASNTDGEIESQRIPTSKKQTDYLYYDDSSEIEEDEPLPVPPKFPSNKTTTKQLQLDDGFSTTTDSDRTESGSFERGYKNNIDKNTNILEHILRDIQSIKIDVKNLMKMVNNERISQFETLDNQLNFKNYKDLEDFNNKLLDEHYFNKMKLSISLLGGRDLSDSTRKIASLLISHELILKMNWTGVNEKFSLVKLQNILKLIYVSVRRNPICANSTNNEINHQLKNWIKNAPDREGGRSARNKK